jgi:hypothetical protein
MQSATHTYLEANPVPNPILGKAPVHAFPLGAHAGGRVSWKRCACQRRTGGQASAVPSAVEGRSMPSRFIRR